MSTKKLSIFVGAIFAFLLVGGAIATTIYSIINDRTTGRIQAEEAAMNFISVISTHGSEAELTGENAARGSFLTHSERVAQCERVKDHITTGSVLSIDCSLVSSASGSQIFNSGVAYLRPSNIKLIKSEDKGLDAMSLEFNVELELTKQEFYESGASGKKQFKPLLIKGVKLDMVKENGTFKVSDSNVLPTLRNATYLWDSGDELEFEEAVPA